MNSGATSERVYDALKVRILSGEFRPGERLDPAMLADSLAASVTPVRDALHLLTGEDLVTTRTSEGFHMPAVHEPGLRDLYRWNAHLLGIGLAARQEPAIGTRRAPFASMAAATADLFDAIMRRSGNGEHHRAIRSVNDRLHMPRVAEAALLGDIEAELEALRAAWDAERWSELRALLAAYHRRRGRHVAEIVRRLYQGAGPG